MFQLDFWFKNVWEFGWGAQCDTSTMWACSMIDYVQFMVNFMHALGYFGIVMLVLFAIYALISERKHREAAIVQSRLDRFVGR